MCFLPTAQCSESSIQLVLRWIFFFYEAGEADRSINLYFRLTCGICLIFGFRDFYGRGSGNIYITRQRVVRGSMLYSGVFYFLVGSRRLSGILYIGPISVNAIC